VNPPAPSSPRPVRLLAAISAHGYGHAAQTATVLNALRRRVSALRLTVRSAVPEAVLRSHLAGDFEYHSAARDFGMVMTSALEVNVQASAAAYAAAHDDWQHRVAAEADALAAIAPDLVLANVSYLTLAGAAAAGIPAFALCSLNWADIYAHYCGGRPEANAIHAQMLEAYRSADSFLQPVPHMAMDDLPNRRAIGPLARLGTSRRADLDRMLGLDGDERLVLVSLGGIDLRLPVDDWPRDPKLRWVVPRQWCVSHPQAVAFEALGLHFTDVLCSCDALIAKPGYGTFAEAACNGVPTLYVKRPDWPEDPCLIAWLKRNDRALEISRARLARGDLADAVEAVIAMDAPAAPLPNGADEAAELIAARLLVPV
jgi:hypothetical protein